MLHGRVRAAGQAALTQGATILSLMRARSATSRTSRSCRRELPRGRRTARVGRDPGGSAVEGHLGRHTEASGRRQPQRGAPGTPRTCNSALAVNTGDVGAGLAGAAKVVSASYFTAYQSHGVLAELLGRRCHSGRHDGLLLSQGPYLQTLPAIAIGTRGAGDIRPPRCSPAPEPTGTAPTTTASIAAALMSQVGKSVRVQFMRWDEHGWDQFGPAQATDVRAGIDANGNIVGYDYTAYNHGWTQVVESSAELAGTPLPPHRAGRSTRPPPAPSTRSRTAASRARS